MDFPLRQYETAAYPRSGVPTDWRVPSVWSVGCESRPPRSAAAEGRELIGLKLLFLTHLHGQIPLIPKLGNLVHLGFQPVHVFFLFLEQPHKQIA